MPRPADQEVPHPGAPARGGFDAQPVAGVLLLDDPTGAPEDRDRLRPVRVGEAAEIGDGGAVALPAAFTAGSGEHADRSVPHFVARAVLERVRFQEHPQSGSKRVTVEQALQGRPVEQHDAVGVEHLHHSRAEADGAALGPVFGEQPLIDEPPPTNEALGVPALGPEHRRERGTTQAHEAADGLPPLRATRALLAEPPGDLVEADHHPAAGRRVAPVAVAQVREDHEVARAECSLEMGDEERLAVKGSGGPGQRGLERDARARFPSRAALSRYASRSTDLTRTALPILIERSCP